MESARSMGDRRSEQPEVTVPAVRQVQVQVIDRGLTATFVKTVHRIPLPDGGGLSVVRKRSVGVEPTRGAVILIHGFGQNRYTWHTPYRSLVNYLAFRGYDVFNLELRGLGRSGLFGSEVPDHPDVHFEVDIPRAVAGVREIARTDQVFVIGHSLGGAGCYAAAPLVAAVVRGVVTIAGLYRFAAVPGLLAVVSWLTSQLDRARRPSVRELPLHRVGRLMRLGQKLMNSRLYRWVPAQTWFPGTIEEPLLAYLNQSSYDRASLGVALAIAWWGRHGRITSRTGHDFLDAFDRLDVPLLVVAGSHDLLIPAAGARRAYERSHSSDKTLAVFGPQHGGHDWGHVDLIMGTDAPRYVWVTIADWLDAH